MKKRSLLLFIITIFLTLPPVFAKTKKSKNTDEEYDMNLFEIDRLIRRTEYEQALRQLNAYLVNNPDNFDNAQSRIARIMKARRQYKDDFEDLVATFKKINPDTEADEEDLDDVNLEDTDEDAFYAKCNKIKDNLNSIEHNPPEEIKEVLDQIDSTITLNYVRPRAEKILRRSAKLAHNGDYVAAIEQLREGFEFFKVDYYIQWQDYPELTDETDAAYADLQTYITEFEEGNLVNRIAAAVNAFNRSVEEDRYSDALQNLSTVRTLFAEYRNLRSRIYTVSERLQNIYNREKELNPEATGTDASYLPFLIRFINGSSAVKDSGVAGVIGCEGETFVSSMNSTVYAMVEKYYDNYTKELAANISSSEAETASTPFYTSGITNYTTLEKSVIDSFDLIKSPSVYETLGTPFSNYLVLASYLPELVGVSNTIRSVNSEINKIHETQLQSFTDLESDLPAGTKASVVSALFNSVAQMGNLVGVRQEQELTSFDWAEDYNKAEDTQWNELGQLYTQILDKVFTDSSTMLNQSWEKISQYYMDRSDELVDAVSDYNTYTQKYFDGFYVKIPENIHSEILNDASKAITYVNTFETDENENLGIYYNYPDISRNLSAWTQSQIDKNVSTINDYESLIDSSYNSHTQWASDEGITGLVRSTDDYFEQQKDKLNSLRTASLALTNQAEERINSAQTAWNNGNERYEYAQFALTQENFDLARQTLTEASNYYSDALALMDNNQWTSDSVEKLSSLREEINKTENEYVVKEVREHINNAWSYFYAGRYDNASDELAVANSRWHTTNSNDNEEIKKLTGYVNNARTSQSGFEISQTDPLYQEMSQRLSTANEFYNSGSSKYAKGDKAGGNSDFDSAEEKLNEVKSVYPLNLSAQILSLKIEKLQNPGDFNKNFAEKIDAASVQCKSSDKDVQDKGLAYLKAYYEIDPDYKGLSQKIVQAEIDTGARPKPVDNSAKNRAQTLYVQALRTFNAAGSSQTQLQRSLTLVDQAIDLDSTLREATALKDRIMIRIGGSQSSELTPEDQIRFNQAAEQLDAGYVARARRIIEELYNKNSNYRNNADFMELYNEIQNR